MKCEMCAWEGKGLRQHIWRVHSENGDQHRPSTGKGRAPWNKGLTRATDARIASSAAKIRESKPTPPQMTAELREKISRSMRGNRNANHRGKKVVYRSIKMDSTWEAGVAAYFDEIGSKWSYGEVCYPLDEKRSYRPDFLLDDGRIIEVKGYWRKENREKFDEWRRLYPTATVEVWDKGHLRALGVITTSGEVVSKYHAFTTAVPQNKSKNPRVPKRDQCPVCGKPKRLSRAACSLICSGVSRQRLEWDALDLRKLLLEHGNTRRLALYLGVSWNGLKKQLTKRGIDPRGL